MVMVWKSNLDENDTEFIEDFGAKETVNNNQQMGGVPPASSKKLPKKAARLNSAAKSRKGDSPSKSIMKSAHPTTAAVDVPADYQY